jgi:hypothetical protein
VTTNDEDQMSSPPSRAGSGPDLARRMDRIEGRQDSIELEVRTLAATVGRVELNQAHATELAKLRFDAIDNGMKAGFSELGAFQQRIEGILDGSIQTQQQRQGAEILADYLSWRKTVDSFMTQGRFLGRLAVILVSTNIIAIVVAVGAALNAAGRP